MAENRLLVDKYEIRYIPVGGDVKYIQAAIAAELDGLRRAQPPTMEPDEIEEEKSFDLESFGSSAPKPPLQLVQALLNGVPKSALFKDTQSAVAAFAASHPAGPVTVLTVKIAQSSLHDDKQDVVEVNLKHKLVKVEGFTKEQVQGMQNFQSSRPHR